MPSSVPKDRVLLEGEGTVNSSTRANIEYLLYIDPALLTAKVPEQVKLSARNYVHEVNSRLGNVEKGKGRYLIVAPGRWGSKESSTGISATFSDFSNAAGTAEIYAGMPAEYSWGTHFGQDYVHAAMVESAFEFEREDGRPQFMHEGEHDTEMPEVPDELKPYIKVVNVDREHRRKNAGSADLGKKPYVVHVAQDNTHHLDKRRPSHIYIAQFGEDLPAPTQKKPKK
jgi:hypothetical protein